MAGAMIDIKDLTKRFGNYAALKGVTLAVGEGVSFALLGPNGAGKTTLVRILSTLIKPAAGTARIAGFDVANDAREVKRVIGVVSHNTFLYDELTALENLEFYAGAYGVDGGNIPGLLENIGLTAWRHEPVGNFSRGMKQRLSIARALLHDPRVLILDEPTTGLDVQGRRVFHNTIKELHKTGKTIFLTTHQMEDVEKLCDEVAILHKGEMKAAGTLKEVKGDASLEEVFLELTEDG